MHKVVQHKNKYQLDLSGGTWFGEKSIGFKSDVGESTYEEKLFRGTYIYNFQNLENQMVYCVTGVYRWAKWIEFVVE